MGNNYLLIKFRNSLGMKYLKRNPVTVARQIDYTFRVLCGKVTFGGMHIGQTLKYERRNFWIDR